MDVTDVARIEEDFVLEVVYMGMMTRTGYGDGHQAKHDGGAIFNERKAQEVKVTDNLGNVYLDLAVDEEGHCIRRIVNDLPN